MNQKSFSIGLTGGIGSGKTTVAKLFAARGATIVDTDAIAHQLTAPGGAALDAIGAAFGGEVIGADGALDRAAMRARAFADPAAKARLEAILHPLIRVESDRQAAAASGAYVMFDVPLLAQSGYWRARVARVLVVDCPETLQVSRVVARNGLREEQVRAIIATQASRAERLAAADDVIVNDGDLAALTQAVDRLHAQYLQLVGKSNAN